MHCGRGSYGYVISLDSVSQILPSLRPPSSYLPLAFRLPVFGARFGLAFEFRRLQKRYSTPSLTRQTILLGSSNAAFISDPASIPRFASIRTHGRQEFRHRSWNSSGDARRRLHLSMRFRRSNGLDVPNGSRFSPKRLYRQFG